MWIRRFFAVLAIVSVAARGAEAGLLVAASGSLQNCTVTPCIIGCSRDGQTTGVGANGLTNGCTGASCTGSCSGTSLAYDFIQPDGASTLSLQVLFTAGTTATVFLEQSIDGGATWFAIASKSYTGTETVPSPVVITNPTGRYRSNLQATAGGTLTYAVKYKAVRLTNQ